MKFILWTLVWWGLVEIGYWRIYYFRGVEYVDKNSVAYLIHLIIMGILYFYLYNKYIK